MKREVHKPWDPDSIRLRWVLVNPYTGKRMPYEERRGSIANSAAIIANAAINKTIGKDN